MHRTGFEPTIPVFERKMTVRVLDSAATVIGFIVLYPFITLTKSVILSLGIDIFFLDINGVLYFCMLWRMQPVFWKAFMFSISVKLKTNEKLTNI
jgi:hypothetical protein